MLVGTTTSLVSTALVLKSIATTSNPALLHIYNMQHIRLSTVSMHDANFQLRLQLVLQGAKGTSVRQGQANWLPTPAEKA